MNHRATVKADFANTAVNLAATGNGLSETGALMYLHAVVTALPLKNLLALWRPFYTFAA